MSDFIKKVVENIKLKLDEAKTEEQLNAVFERFVLRNKSADLFGRVWDHYSDCVKKLKTEEFTKKPAIVKLDNGEEININTKEGLENYRQEIVTAKDNSFHKIYREYSGKFDSIRGEKKLGEIFEAGVKALHQTFNSRPFSNEIGDQYLEAVRNLGNHYKLKYDFMRKDPAYGKKPLFKNNVNQAENPSELNLTKKEDRQKYREQLQKEAGKIENSFIPKNYQENLEKYKKEILKEFQQEESVFIPTKTPTNLNEKTDEEQPRLDTKDKKTSFETGVKNFNNEVEKFINKFDNKKVKTVLPQTWTDNDFEEKVIVSVGGYNYDLSTKLDRYGYISTLKSDATLVTLLEDLKKNMISGPSDIENSPVIRKLIDLIIEEDLIEKTKSASMVDKKQVFQKQNIENAVDNTQNTKEHKYKTFESNEPIKNRKIFNFNKRVSEEVTEETYDEIFNKALERYVFDYIKAPILDKILFGGIYKEQLQKNRDVGEPEIVLNYLIKKDVLFTFSKTDDNILVTKQLIKNICSNVVFNGYLKIRKFKKNGYLKIRKFKKILNNINLYEHYSHKPNDFYKHD